MLGSVGSQHSVGFPESQICSLWLVVSILALETVLVPWYRVKNLISREWGELFRAQHEQKCDAFSCVCCVCK